MIQVNGKIQNNCGAEHNISFQFKRSQQTISSNDREGLSSTSEPAMAAVKYFVSIETKQTWRRRPQLRVKVV